MFSAKSVFFVKKKFEKKISKILSSPQGTNLAFQTEEDPVLFLSLWKSGKFWNQKPVELEFSIIKVIFHVTSSNPDLIIRSIIQLQQFRAVSNWQIGQLWPSRTCYVNSVAVVCTPRLTFGKLQLRTFDLNSYGIQA